VANLRRIPVRHEDVFPDGVLFLGIEAAIDFDRRTDVDNQLRDKDSGLRVWQVSVLDPTGDRGSREVVVKVVGDVQPVPPGGMMKPVEFDGLSVTPWVNEKNRSQVSLRANGFVSSARASSLSSVSASAGVKTS